MHVGFESFASSEKLCSSKSPDISDCLFDSCSEVSGDFCSFSGSTISDS